MPDMVGKAHPCMIEFNEMLLKRLSKITCFTGKAVPP